jgi:tetratricopeptide (TPR) repeat protein
MYARAWALLATGQQKAAEAYIEEVYAGSDDPDTVAQYLYLAFREPTKSLLPQAEARAQAAIEQFPEQAARFHSAHGRLLRRMGRLAEAEEAFAAAVEIAAPDNPSLGTYRGQLEFVRRQLAAAGG